MPPNQKHLQYIQETAKDIDMESRRRLDRRTLYRGLLFGLMPHYQFNTNDSKESNANNASGKKSNNNLISNRRYLDNTTSRFLSAIPSLANQNSANM